MAMTVSKHIEGHYEIELFRPEETWLALLAGKMLTEDVTVLSMAVEQGLIQLMSQFGKPDKLELSVT